MAVFAAWLAITAWQVWRREAAGTSAIDLLLARSATLIVALLAAHSFVDYPLRTTGMMVFLGFACGLLVPAPAAAAREAARDRSEARREPAEKRAAVPRPQPAPQPQPARSPAPASAPASGAGELWGQGIEWPEEWRGSTRPGAAGRPGRPGEPPKKD
jgi:hypothetical protein